MDGPESARIVRDEVESLRHEIQDLQSSLTKERVLNLECHQIQKEMQMQITELTDSLAAQKAQNQKFSNHAQELELFLEDRDLLIAEQQLRIQALQTQRMEQQQSEQSEQNEFGGKFDSAVKFEEDGDGDGDSDDSESKGLRHRLLNEQMKNEQLQRSHRASIYKLEQLEMDHLSTESKAADAAGDDDTERLQREVEALRAQLQTEKKKRENLDRERRSSLAALSQNMFKKLLDSEHQHYDDKSDLERQCEQLKKIVHHLEKSKHSLLKETNQTIDKMRSDIKLLASRLQRYENWQ